MKKTLKIHLYKSGTENDTITKIVANYNEGKREISPRDLEGYFWATNCAYPSIRNLSLIKGDSPNEYHVSEDGGKTFTMTLEWAETYELSETEKEIEQELN